MQLGQRNLAQLEPPYRALVSEVGETYVDAGEYSDVVQASYGYVYGVARHVINDVAYPQAVEAEVARVLPDKNEPGTRTSLDKEYRALIEQETGEVGDD
jgi:predicted amidohydrolase YtcJ